MELQNSGNRFTQMQQTKSKRELIIDLARGFAVALMVITHVIAILYSPAANDSLIYYIGEFGGIASFTTFLFLSGVSGYFSFLKYSSDNEDVIKNAKRKLLGRVIKILIIYYVLATASTFVNTTLYSFPPTLVWGENLIRTVLLLFVPTFTEFLITIIIYSGALVFLRKFFRYLSENPLLAIFLSIVLFTLGQLLLQVDLGTIELNTLKGIVAGHQNLHFFPILQYFPIFMFGILFGRFLYNTEERSKRVRFLIISFLSLGALSLGLGIFYHYLQLPILNPFQAGRFPISIAFIIFSLFCTVTIILLLTLLNKAIPRIVKVVLHYFGVNSLEMFFFHIIVLFGIKYLTISVGNPEGAKFLYPSDILILYIATLVISVILTNIKDSMKHWSLSASENDNATWWFFTEKTISTLIFIAVFGFLGGTVYRELFVKPAQANTTDFQFKKRAIQEEEWPKWWNYEYKSSRMITITNNSPLPMFEGSWVGLNFNHKDALGRKSATRPDGNDVRIVYYDFDLAEFKELPFIFEGINTESAKIYFKISENIASNSSSDRYFIYYGNEFTEDYPKANDRFGTPPAEDNIKLGDETSQNLNAKVNKRWFLKKKATAYQAASLLFETNIEASQLSTNSVITYSVAGTDKSGKMKKVGDTLYQAAVVVSDLEPGVYRIQANIVDSSDGINIKRSLKIPFYVTYPLYVTWTMDWEGWDVDQANLNDIAGIADRNGMPITHFFNPRIYVKNQYTMQKITEERADYITDWVKERQKNKFEEIGMHIHMWADMVAEAGVTPRTAVIQGTYGTDIPSYVYTQEELEKVFKWGRQKFAEFGLGAPVSYRTGAWMSGTNVLLAAQNAGFLIDSSGRTGGPVNPTISYSTQVPWSLSETARPYLPNLDNINTWNGNLEKRMKIWEYPNNGADSYWFSQNELFRRFDLNYPTKGDILYTPQVVTYLSHPHWFLSVDSYKIKNLFGYINQYMYKNDQGPVVYETLENIYSEWDRDKFINGN